MTAQPTPKGAWRITFLLFLFMLVNFADKIVVGLAGVPIMTEMKLEPDLAAIGGIEARDQVQQRALAAAGFTRQRDAFAGGDVEAHPAQHADLLAGRAIGLGQVTNAQHNDIAFMRRSISAAA